MTTVADNAGMMPQADPGQVTEHVKKVRGRQFPRYSAYRPSGIDCLGAMPDHWGIKRLKFTVSEPLKYGANEPAELDDPMLPRFIRITDISDDGSLRDDTFRSIPEDAARGYLLCEGDLLLARSGATVGKSFLYRPSWGRAAFAGYLIRARFDAHKAVPAFFNYFTNSHSYWQWLSSIFIQTTIQNVSAEKYANLVVPIPPFQEQCSIVAFLDRETAEIDALIAKKRRLIELLQEKRTALISHAVTKGLNPKAPMKPSRIDWLGDVPAHWEILPLRRYAKSIQTGCTPPTNQTEYYEQGTLPWYGPGSFSDDLALGEPTKLINLCAVQEGAARLFRMNSVLIVTIGATVGKVGLLSDDASTNQQITAVTVEPRRVDGRFLAYQLKIREPVLRGTAPGNTLPILDQQAIAAFPAVLPPIAEQRQIVAYLDDHDLRLRTPLVKITQAIGLLREHRSALISAAVTGKIDVRGEVG